MFLARTKIFFIFCLSSIKQGNKLIQPTGCLNTYQEGNESKGKAEVRTRNQGKESKRTSSWIESEVMTAQGEQGSGRINKLEIRPFTMREEDSAMFNRLSNQLTHHLVQ